MSGNKERRTYDQRCALAVALDLVGERWTLLLVRELLLRPRRYRDLWEALPGIGTNLLADRLAFLTAAGVVRPLEPGKRTGGYTLTEFGERLREPVLALSRFGLAALEDDPTLAGSAVRPTWAALAIEAMLDERRSPDVDEIYEFDVDGETFHVVTGDGHARVHAGTSTAATLRITSDAATFLDIGMRKLDPLEAVLSGAVTAAGPPAAVTRCLRLLGLGQEAATRPEPVGEPAKAATTAARDRGGVRHPAAAVSGGPSAP